jgi:hypothetical protein
MQETVNSGGFEKPYKNLYLIAITRPTTQNNLKQFLLGWYYYRLKKTPPHHQTTPPPHQTETDYN